MYAFTIIGLQPVTNLPGIILETLSLITGIASAIIDNVEIVISSIFTTWASGMYGMAISENAIDKVIHIQMINTGEIMFSPFMIFGVLV